MAKVYDALRRAEAERASRVGEESPPALLSLDRVGRARPAAERRWSWKFWRWRPWRWRPWQWRPWKGRWRRRRDSTGAGKINKRRIALLQPESYVAEQYRALRVRIDAIATQRPIRTLALTSAMSGEGKTTAAINLAVVTAMSLGRRVLLVDCDMRKPKIHEALGLRPDAGLAEVLVDAVDLDQAIVKVEGVNLEVLPVFKNPANPSELLGSLKMRECIEELARRYDRVILDTPAALGLPDSKTVCDLCDGLIMVVRADRTSQQDMEMVLDMMDRRRLLGLVLNGVHVDQGRYGYTT